MSDVFKDLHSNKLFYVSVKYSDWLVFPDNFGKNKVKIIKYHAKIENKWLLLSKNNDYFDYITSVNVAEVNGKLYKINGLIRKSLWQEGKLKSPDMLSLCVYKLDKSHYDELFDILYPISLTSKSQSDVLKCYKNLGLSFKSDRLKHGYITEALNIALRSEPRALQDKRSIKIEINLDRAIETFQTELIIIDNVPPNLKIFSTGIVAAALIMLSIDQKNINFFKKLNDQQGEIKKDKIDPVEALLRTIESLKKKSLSEGRTQVELCAKTIRAIKIWNLGKEDDKFWIQRLMSIDFSPDIRQMKIIKGIHGIREF